MGWKLGKRQQTLLSDPRAWCTALGRGRGKGWALSPQINQAQLGVEMWVLEKRGGRADLFH